MLHWSPASPKPFHPCQFERWWAQARYRAPAPPAESASTAWREASSSLGSPCGQSELRILWAGQEYENSRVGASDASVKAYAPIRYRRPWQYLLPIAPGQLIPQNADGRK